MKKSAKNIEKFSIISIIRLYLPLLQLVIKTLSGGVRHVQQREEGFIS